MTRRKGMDRREFVTTAGAAAAAAALGPNILIKRPQKTLKIMQWSHFVPAYDAWFDKYAKDWGTQKGVEVTVGEDLKAFHDLYVHTAERDRFTPRPLRYFETMFAAMSAEDPERIRLYLARHQGDLVAATILVRVGTHAEIKNSHIGAGTAISHFSAVLDSDVGADANIGAGTVTANFDGLDKHRTEIGDRAQVGSDTILVAPVRVGDDAYTAAGSVITSDVPAGSLAIERSEQKDIPGWTERRKGRRKREVST